MKIIYSATNKRRNGSLDPGAITSFYIQALSFMKIIEYSWIPISEKFYNKYLIARKKLELKFQSITKYIKNTIYESNNINTKKKKFKNISNWFSDYYTVEYKIRQIKNKKFLFNYLWQNLWSLASFFTSSFGKLRSAWLYFKNTRTNYFSTFYYSGALYKFIKPGNLGYLNENSTGYRLKPDSEEKEEKALPYKLHPYVSYAHSPYNHVHATCSSGTIGFKKKHRRSKDALYKMKDYFNIFFTYYFSLYKIDFLFFRFNGIFKLFKALKNKMFDQFRVNFYNLRKLFFKSRKLKKALDLYDDNRDEYPKLIGNLIAMISAKVPAKTLVPDKETEEYLKKSMEKSDVQFNAKRAKLSKLNFKILHYISKFPKFIYVLDTTAYPFNGCRRVRHYKK